MPFTLAIGAGIGLIKAIGDQQKEKSDRNLAAAQVAYSPWTKINPNDAIAGISHANPVGDVAGGAFAGYSMGKGMQNTQSSTDLNNAMANRYNSGGSILGNGQVMRQVGGAAGGAPVIHGPQELDYQTSPYGFTSPNYRGAGSAKSSPYYDYSQRNAF
jgi:hypothetical protein